MGTLRCIPDNRKPYLGTYGTLLGYSGHLKREERAHELMQFHRKEQMRKLKNPGVRLYVEAPR